MTSPGHCAPHDRCSLGRHVRTIVLVGVFAALCGCASVQAPADKSAAGAAPEAQPDFQIVRLDFAASLASGEDVVIDNPYGDVRLRFGGYEHAIETHAVAQQPLLATPIALQPVTEGPHYLITPRLPAGTLVADRQRLDLVVFVPLGHAVSVRTERGTIESRGIRADIDLKSSAGDIAIRGTQGSVSAETGAGSIEASLGKAPAGSRQRLATTSGNIIVAVADSLDARVEMATSAPFATEYSLQVTPRPGQEPNKQAVAVVGEDRANVSVESRRGEIRLLRWSGFTSTDGKPGNEEEADSDSD